MKNSNNVFAEVGPNFRDGQVLVADAHNGQPLATAGPFQLIVSEDHRPARWVRNLYSVVLQRRPLIRPLITLINVLTGKVAFWKNTDNGR